MACKGTTKTGKPCKSTSLIGDYCFSHQPEEVKTSRGFGVGQPGSGRPRIPRAHELMREWAEQHMHEILDPYILGLSATITIRVRADGEDEAITTEMPDIELRQKSAERLLDRVYGKPAQAVELTGAEGKPPVEIVQVDDREVAIAAQDFLRRLSS